MGGKTQISTLTYEKDEACEGCHYYRPLASVNTRYFYCAYLEMEKRVRGCPPGEFCNKKMDKKTVKRYRELQAILYKKKRKKDTKYEGISKSTRAKYGDSGC